MEYYVFSNKLQNVIKHNSTEVLLLELRALITIVRISNHMSYPGGPNYHHPFSLY